MIITNQPRPVIGKTTRLVLTTHLRATTWLRQFDPLMVLVVALLLGAIGAGLWIERTPPAAPVVAPLRDTRPLIVFATAEPTVALPTVAPAPTSAPVPTPAPAPAPAEQEISVQNVPAAPLQQPATQPATGWHADPQIEQRESGSMAEITVPAGATRYCTGFGDWRDYDAMFASSPACNP